MIFPGHTNVKAPPDTELGRVKYLVEIGSLKSGLPMLTGEMDFRYLEDNIWILTSLSTSNSIQFA